MRTDKKSFSNYQKLPEIANTKLANNVIVEEKRKLSGAILLGPDGNVIKVGHSLNDPNKGNI